MRENVTGEKEKLYSFIAVVKVKYGYYTTKWRL